MRPAGRLGHGGEIVRRRAVGGDPIGGDPGYPGLYGPLSAPAPRKPHRLAFLETAGWAAASPGAKAAMADALARFKAAGIDVRTRQSHTTVAAVDGAIAQARPLSMRINTWEWRWPLC